MNNAAIELAAQMADREYSLIEYRNRLVRMQNMGCICHCSAEIDMGTLLYFSVNDLYLGQGAFLLVLFSEVSDNSSDQEAGRDVYGRMFTYAIIEEVVKEVFTGHYSFYSSELDGRLVMIVNFHYGLYPDRSIVRFLDNGCREVHEKCRDRYDMDVVSYIGDLTENVRNVSSVYTKLLERASLHRFMGYAFADAVYHVEMPSPLAPSDRRSSIDQLVQSLAAGLLAGADYHALAEVLLDDIAEQRASNIDELKRMFGDCFENLCQIFGQMGIKLKTRMLREEQFRILNDSVHWSENKAWFHRFLDEAHREYSEGAQRAARRELEKAMQFIEDSLGDPDLTIEKCAAAAGCSVSSLTKAFRRQMNTSAAKYIRDRRLEKALSLIRQGMSVRETCAACGFGSTETFHRVFKARYGITPGQLRGADPGMEGEETSRKRGEPA